MVLTSMNTNLVQYIIVWEGMNRGNKWKVLNQRSVFATTGMGLHIHHQKEHKAAKDIHFLELQAIALAYPGA